MATIEQWVNLEAEDKWLGEGVTSLRRLGRSVRVDIKFSKAARHVFYLSVTPDGGNAAYTRSERVRRMAFWPIDFRRLRGVTEDDGTYWLNVPLAVAGGDKYTFKVEDDKGNEKSVDVETRRKLYYQIIRMNGAHMIDSGTINGFQDHYWNPDEKVFVKLVQIAPGSTIPDRLVLDSSVSAQVDGLRNHARRVYNRQKAPQAFVVILVRKICKFGWETRFVRKVITGSSLTVSTLKPLAVVADPSMNYYSNIVWVPDEGSPVRLGPELMRRTGEKELKLDTRGLPRGQRGRMAYRLRVCKGLPVGLSYRTENLTIVATESFRGRAMAAERVLQIINHEVGHKIGMVPSTDAESGLDAQSSVYEGHGHQGRHCSTGVSGSLPADFLAPGQSKRGTCVMFGDLGSRTTEFCSVCLGSLRKLDLRGDRSPGLKNQF